MEIGNAVKIFCEFEDEHRERAPAQNIKLTIYDLRGRLLQEFDLDESHNLGNNVYAVWWVPTVTEARATLSGIVDGLPEKKSNLLLK
jgi:hypothetical protein